MPAPRLELPILQNWSCHSCGGCCRHHDIIITEEERRRILGLTWDAAAGPPAGQPLVVSSGPPWNRTWRLAHQADGACIFLDDNERCRIHAAFGEHTKPLACRVYPYAFHPAGKKVVVSLRFSCPSVAANHGRSPQEQLSEIRRLATAVVPQQAADIPPPEVARGSRVDWPDFLRFVSALEGSFAEDAPLELRLRRILYWVRFVEQARFDKLRGRRIDELLTMLRDAARSEVIDASDVPPPGAAGRMQFRMLTAQYARRDTFADRRSGLRGRLRLLLAAVRFTRGRGLVPPLQDCFRPVPFALLEQPFGPVPAATVELMDRFFRVKVQGLHFCGPAFYGSSFVAGTRSLVLLWPVVAWLARWLAASDGRSEWTTTDFETALGIADHHHGYSPALAQWNYRRRVQTLDRTDDIARLCVWYGGRD